ncbi:alpha/beta fold hydrolase [Robertmurraya andreesenii]|uniref:Pimeloyl-ACP methyl ester carboxylesterase n=1 Tax=Anoxybacillus andreesenii TaxID=1325932 RepID=A0ABT9V328_9BACL|nr:alpha/beta hydrolase [Robertmurraya andreesenii]MDQ0155348.1 pimeloyl-ACP methyl ester carboxylesterase [Robertmurraya andreesenii]
MSVLKGKQKINGNDLYYEHYLHETSSKTILLIHGFLSSTFSFRRLIPLLCQEYNVISIDFPPFGKSGKSTRYVYSYNNIAKSILSLLEQLHIREFVVIGHSMGGQLSLNIAYLRPDLVKKVVLLCSSGYLERSKQSLIYLSYLPFFHLFIKRYLEKSGVMKNLQNVVFNQQLIDEEMFQGYMEPFLNEEIFKGLARLLRHREGDLSEEMLHKIETPCLLIWGEEDKVVPLSIGKRLQKDLKNSRLIVLSETGHLVPEERPKEVFQHIVSFLQETEVHVEA